MSGEKLGNDRIKAEGGPEGEPQIGKQKALAVY